MTLTTERQQFAEQNEMSLEFVNWFFDEKKESFGNMWFLMAAALWEGWKGRANREVQPVLYASEETLAYAKEGEKSLVTWSEPMGDAVIPLYAAPPAPANPDFDTIALEASREIMKIGERIADLPGGACQLQAIIQCRIEKDCRAATPAPAAAGELLEAMEEIIRISDRDHEAWDKAKAAISACRAAMLAQPVSGGYKLPESWISSDERMPKDGDVVLVFEEGGIIFCAEVDNGEFYPDEFPLVPTRGKEITHWMPLPAAPEGGNG